MGNCGVTFAPVQPGQTGDPGRDDGVGRGHPGRRASSTACRGTGRPTASTSTPSTALPEGHQRRRHGRPLRGAHLRDGRARPASETPRHRRRHRRRWPAWSTRRMRRRRARLLDLAHADPPRARRPPGAGHVGRPARSSSPSARCWAGWAGRLRVRAAVQRDRRRRARVDEEIAWMGELSRAPAARSRSASRRCSPSATTTAGCVELAEEANRAGAQSGRRPRARGIGVLFGLARQHAVRRAAGVRAPLRRSPLDGAAGRDPRPRRAAPRLVADGRGAADRPVRAIYLLPRRGRRPATTLRRRATRLAAHGRPRAACARSRRSSTLVDRERRRRARELPVPQPGPRRGRGDARRTRHDHRPGRRRRPRRPDHGRQPADVLPVATGSATGGARARGGRPAAHLATPPTLFGFADRGVLAPGAFADVNVIDLEPWVSTRPSSCTTSRAAPAASCSAPTGSPTRSSTAGRSWRTASTPASCPAGCCAAAWPERARRLLLRGVAQVFWMKRTMATVTPRVTMLARRAVSLMRRARRAPR